MESEEHIFTLFCCSPLGKLTLLYVRRRSTKSRKKAENKKHRLREGSRYEEEALVEVLREVVTSSDGVREDVHKLLSTLTQFGRSGEALELQTRYEELLEAIRKEMNTIWPPETSSQTTIDTPSSLVS